MISSKLFRLYGKFIATHPWIGFIVFVVVNAGLLVGFRYQTLQSNPNELWVNPASITAAQATIYNEQYGPYFRIEQMIFVLEDEALESEIDIFEQDYLQEVYYVQTIIENLGFNYTNGTTLYLTDLCERAVPGSSGCSNPSPMGYWQNNLTRMLDDPNIKYTAQCIQSVDPTNNFPCEDQTGLPIIANQVLGGIGCQGNVTMGTCASCNYTAEALIVTMLLEEELDENEEDLPAMAWEQDVFINVIQQYNNGSLNLSYYFPGLNISRSPLPLKIAYMAQRSVEDELQAETYSNIWVIVVSYTLMFFYICLTIGSFPSRMHNGVWLAILGILIVAFSVASGYGMCGYLGVPGSLISVEVIPFLILAIGVDNMFILTSSYRRNKLESPGITIPQTMSRTLGEVGPSIVTAATCEVIAFAVGFLTKVPAVTSFCAVAACAVGLDFVFQFTVFVAGVTYDERRKESLRNDPIFCIKYNKDKKETPREDLMPKIFKKYITPLFLSWPCVITALVASAGLLILSSLTYKKLELGLDQMTTVREKSDLYNYFQNQEEYVEVGPESFVIILNANYTDQNQLNIISNMSNYLAAKTDVISPPIYSWINGFQTFINVKNFKGWSGPCNMNQMKHMTFDQQVKFYVDIPMNRSCCLIYGQCGGQYAEDILFDPVNGNIKTTRLRFSQSTLTNQTVFINSLIETSQIVEYFSEQMNATYFNTPSVYEYPTNQDAPYMFPYSFYYVWFEQYETIRAIAFENIIFAVLAIYGCTLILSNMKAALVLTFLIFNIMFNIIGVVYILNLMFETQIMINAISVVNVLAAAGLGVEFSLHILLRYIKNTGKKKERIENAMNCMGSTVFVGIVVTKLIGVSILSLASSEIFKVYYFRMYIAIIILGSFYGLIVLPAVLMIIGGDRIISKERMSSIVDEKIEEIKHQSDVQRLSKTQESLETPFVIGSSAKSGFEDPDPDKQNY